MKIIVESAAVFVGRDGERCSPQSAELGAMDGAALGDEECAWYLSDALGDAGVIGGKSFLAVSDQRQPRVHTIYWSPCALTTEQEQELLADTIGQWEDGVGSDGFPLSVGGRAFIVMPRPDETTSISQHQDERVVPAPSK